MQHSTPGQPGVFRFTLEFGSRANDGLGVPG
jgi:hypothetical protein